MLQLLSKLFKSNARLSYLTHFRHVVMVYLLGSLLGIFISWFVVSVTNGQALPLSFTLMYFLGALFLALPVLFGVLVVLLFGRKIVEQYLIVWCVAAVILVPLAWIALEFLSQFAGQVKLIEYLSMQGVLPRVLSIGIFAACCSFLYYRRIKKALSAVQS